MCHIMLTTHVVVNYSCSLLYTHTMRTPFTSIVCVRALIWFFFPAWSLSAFFLASISAVIKVSVQATNR